MDTHEPEPQYDTQLEQFVQPDPNQQQQQQAPAAPMVPLDQVMQLMQARPAPAPAPAPQQQQMSPEQLAAHLRQFDVNEDYATGFATAFQPDQEGRIDAKRAQTAVKSLIEGVRSEYLRALELHENHVDRKLSSTVSPVEAFITEQKAERAWGEFASTYPQLKNFRQFVDMAADQLGAQFPPGTTKQQAFQMVAGYVSNQLQGMGIALPQVKQNVQQQLPGAQHAPAPMMTQMPSGIMPVRGGPPAKSQNGNAYYDSETFGR